MDKEPPMSDPKNQVNFFDAIGRASIMGLHFVSGAMVGGGMGYGFDAWLDTRPWGFLVGLFFGLVAGFLNMWRDAKKLMHHD